MQFHPRHPTMTSSVNTPLAPSEMGSNPYRHDSDCSYDCPACRWNMNKMKEVLNAPKPLQPCRSCGEWVVTARTDSHPVALGTGGTALRSGNYRGVRLTGNLLRMYFADVLFECELHEPAIFWCIPDKCEGGVMTYRATASQKWIATRRHSD